MRILGLFLAAFAAILIFTGCESNGGYRVTVESPPAPPPPPRTVVVHEDHHHHPGPPPHAPAHGYRRKHHGHDMVYDRTVGCYSVVGYQDYYYNDGFYFRLGGDGWQISAQMGSDSHWEHADDSRVPGGLKSKYKKNSGKGKKGNQGKGNQNKQSFLEPSPDAEIVQARWGKY